MRVPNIIVMISLVLLGLAVDGCIPMEQRVERETPDILPDRSNREKITSGEPGQKPIVFSTPFMEGMENFEVFQTVYPEAFARLGYDFELVFIPAERSLVEANAGRVDGETGRIPELSEGNRYPNLIRVDESIVPLVIAAYAVDPAIKLNGWSSLADQNYTIVHVRGFKRVEDRLPQYVPSENVIQVDNADQAIAMLVHGRVDLLLIPSGIEQLIQKSEYRDVNIRQVGIIEETGLYPYLHQKHSNLVPQLAAVLKAMKQDGTYRRLVNEALRTPVK